jgi:hypothetical protein
MKELKRSNLLNAPFVTYLIEIKNGRRNVKSGVAHIVAVILISRHIPRKL